MNKIITIKRIPNLKKKERVSKKQIKMANIPLIPRDVWPEPTTINACLI